MTKAVITIAEGRYSVDVSTDAAALLARLEASAGEEITGALEADEYQRRLRMRADNVLRHLELRFDEVVVRPSVDVDVSADQFAISKARLRLRGSLPATARSVSWRYDLAATIYELDVLSNGQLDAQWLEGGHRSRPALIAHRGAQRGAFCAFRLGFVRILPGGIDQILFILALALAGRRGITTEFLAFALAESLAFALTISGAGVPLSPPPGAPRLIAPLVALSIAGMAGETLVAPAMETGRLARVFAYGLVHGIALSPTLCGLCGAQAAASNLLVALVTTIAGVHASQLAVALTALLLVGSPAGPDAHRRLVAVPASIVLGITGFFWAVQRFPVT